MRNERKEWWKKMVALRLRRRIEKKEVLLWLFGVLCMLGPLVTVCTESIAQVNARSLSDAHHFIWNLSHYSFVLFLLFTASSPSACFLVYGLMRIRLLPGYHSSTELIYELWSSVRFCVVLFASPTHILCNKFMKLFFFLSIFGLFLSLLVFRLTFPYFDFRKVKH